MSLPLDPAQAHHVPENELRRSLANPRVDLWAVRQDFARFIQADRRRSRYTCWQQAWNAFTGATERHTGILYITQKCSACSGRMFDRRTGRACTTCLARRTERLTLSPYYVPEPNAVTA